MRCRYNRMRFQRYGGRVAGALVPLKLKGDSVTPLQVAHTGAFDDGLVNEDIGTAVVGMNISISLLKVEPPYGSDLHDLPLACLRVNLTLLIATFRQYGV